jgi:hypothetical protein
VDQMLLLVPQLPLLPLVIQDMFWPMDIAYNVTLTLEPFNHHLPPHVPLMLLPLPFVLPDIIFLLQVSVHHVLLVPHWKPEKLPLEPLLTKLELPLVQEELPTPPYKVDSLVQLDFSQSIRPLI